MLRGAHGRNAMEAVSRMRSVGKLQRMVSIEEAVVCKVKRVFNVLEIDTNGLGKLVIESFILSLVINAITGTLN